MFLKVDHSSGVPLYRQIMEQIKYSIARGALRPGDRLPAIRQLSMQLQVNPNTVVKAYSELEHLRVIETRRGTGTFVSEKKIEMSRDGKMAIITRLAERLVVEAVKLEVHVARNPLDAYSHTSYNIRRQEGESVQSCSLVLRMHPP